MQVFPTHTLRGSLALLIVALATLLATPAFAQSWGRGGGKPTMKDLVPRMMTEEAYSERYSFAVDLDGGGHIGVDFTISNLGLGDGHGMLGVRVRRPGQPPYEFNKKLSRSEWSAASGSFELTFDNTSVRGVGADTFILTHKGARPFELTFKNKIPMWRPGGGQIDVEGGFYAFNLIAPRADVSGRVDGVEVTGARAGYADHVATNVAPFDLATRFTRFRDYNDDVFVMWRDIELTRDNGGQSVTWVVVGYKDAIVFSDASARLKLGNIKADKTGYNVPKVVQLDGRSGKDSIRLIMQGRTMKRTDLLASYGTAAKMIAAAVSEPYQFELRGPYTLQMTIGGASATVEGRSHYTIDYLNH